MSRAKAVHITNARPEEWPAAFDLALAHLGEDIRPARVANALALVAGGALSPQGIFVARQAGRLRGVQVCVPLPGASGLFWLPKTVPPDVPLEERLVAHALSWLKARGAKLAQAILSPLDSAAAASLLRSGFRAVTRLTYFEHALEALAPALSSSLNYVTYSAATRDLFHATLLRSYVGTLDCPELNGVRTIDEIIAGHQGQGNHRPELWWMALEGDRPVAVTLVAEVPDLGAWDLSYLGVVPEARRRGIARQCTAHVLRAARAERAPKLVLAVDDRNEPAVQLYRRLGFVSLDVREVYLQIFHRPLALGSASPSG
jgi:GNAT superfamily N-acetyltransferase